MKRKTLYNPESTETPFDEPLIGGNPSGLLDMNRSRYAWASNLFEVMLNNTWFPKEVDTTGDSKAYKNLIPSKKFMYDRVFAQLSFNDSLQAENLIDNINGFVTNKIVNACLSRQAFEEVLHSDSYAVLLNDVVEDSAAIFDLYKTDSVLNEKNKAIADQYKQLTDGPVTEEKFFYACIANQLLEGVYFLSGFSAIYAIGDEMRGSAEMISFIHRDENVHLALFSNMAKTMLREHPELSNIYVRKNVNDMFMKAYELEVNWMKYITSGGVPGFNDEVIEKTVAWFCEDRMKLLGLGGTGMFDHAEKTYIVSLLEKNGTHNDKKTNFFEGTVSNYSKGSLNFDDF
jgi:ribonucleoside-diphosphate reductase beta chain